MSAVPGMQHGCESQEAMCKSFQQFWQGPPVNGCHFWLQERKRAEQKGDWGGINKFLNRLLVCSCHFKLVHAGSRDTCVHVKAAMLHNRSTRLPAAAQVLKLVRCRR